MQGSEVQLTLKCNGWAEPRVVERPGLLLKRYPEDAAVMYALVEDKQYTNEGKMNTMVTSVLAWKKNIGVQQQ